MGDKINKEFEKYQEDLKTRNKKLKLVVNFEPQEEKLDKAIKDLKEKKITL